MTGAPGLADELRAVLAIAATRAGLDASEAEPIRFSDNAVFRLTGQGVVARIAPAMPDALATAAKEIRVSRWLDGHGLPVVRAVEGIEQPVEVNGRVVTFWHELALAGEGMYPEVAQVLRRLHALPVPTDLGLPPFAPFVRLSEHIDAAVTLPEDDRAWLHDQVTDLRQRYASGLPPGLPPCVVHGNASIDNVVSAADGKAVLLDLDRVAVGPPEWDLATIAVDLTTFGTLSTHEYRVFGDAYGHDVTTWAGFELLRDIRDFRNTCWMVEQAATHPHTQAEAELRVACLRGRRGPRPWGWHAVL